MLQFIVMDTILSQKTMPWGNILLGTSKYYIHAYGSQITALAEILGITPDEANEKLKSVEGFSADDSGEVDQILWEKIVPAFPGWSAQFITPYNNDTVLEALQAGRRVIVLADGAPIGTPGMLHGVRYIGEGKCHDPFTGTERPTSDFPDVKAVVILTKIVEPVPSDQTPPPAEEAKPPAHLVVTLANLPAHEKQVVIAQVENVVIELKKILGV